MKKASKVRMEEAEQQKRVTERLVEMQRLELEEERFVLKILIL